MSYQASFKGKVALAALKEGKTLSCLSQEFKIHPTQITKWKNQALQSTTHHMGELSNSELDTKNNPENPLGIHCDTFAGLVHIEWDEQTPITPISQLVFFVQFLKTCNLFAPWVDDCPLHYHSPNTPSVIPAVSQTTKL